MNRKGSEGNKESAKNSPFGFLCALAIGADRRNIRNLVLLQTAWLAVFGAVLGMIVSAFCTRMLGSLIYGVSFADPLTFFIVTTLIAMLALLASYVPARRAMQVDPMQTLRTE